MKLDVKAVAITAALLWGGCFLLVALVNLAAPSYGVALLELGASIYPGYHAAAGFGSAIVVTLYALADGAVTGAIFAWLYNRLASAGGARAA